MKNTIKKGLTVLGLWKVAVLIFDFLSYHKSQVLFLIRIKKIKEFEHGFFFNSFATGGAEKVQLEIVRSISDHNSAVFISNYCLNDQYKKDFELCSSLYNIYAAVRKRDFYYPFILKVLAKKINNMNQPRLLGCDCQLYYDLLPYLTPNVVIMDLFHTLVHSFEVGPEHWSLSMVEKIQKRIVISYKLQRDFETFYSNNGISPTLLKKIIPIHNFVDKPLNLLESIPKSEKPIALFVCRNHFVKRIHLAGEIAHQLSNSIKFVFIGDNLESEVKAEHRSSIEFTGNISDSKELSKWYQQADFLMMTSSREGLPMVLLEGMSYGLIPLSTNVGAIEEIISSEDLGILIPNHNNENEIVSMFLESFKVLLDNPEKTSRMKQNVKKFVLEEFNLEVFKQSYRQALLV